MDWDRLLHSDENRTERIWLGKAWNIHRQRASPLKNSKQIEVRPIHTHRYHLHIQD